MNPRVLKIVEQTRSLGQTETDELIYHLLTTRDSDALPPNTDNQTHLYKLAKQKVLIEHMMELSNARSTASFVSSLLLMLGVVGGIKANELNENWILLYCIVISIIAFSYLTSELRQIYKDKQRMKSEPHP